MIVVKVRDRDIKVAPMGPVTTGSVGLPVSWHFSEEWDELAKTAVFRVGNDGTEITVAVLEDLCLVPDELLVQANAGENLWIGVYGWKGTNANDTIIPEIAMPTIWTYTRIQDGSQPSGIEPPEGTPGWSEQIQNATDEALRVAHGVAADAAAGEFDGISPSVTISSITHGHSVTITDRDHPTGQSFDVMDGASAYEQAVAGGYTGTEAQFNEELAGFSEKANTAETAAAAAAQSAQSAINSASTAATKAGEAANSASVAEAKAGEAAASAQAAADASSFFTGTILPNAVNTINSTRDQAVANVNVAKSTAVQNVQAEGATQISAVQTESTTQQAAIEQKGEDVLASIPSDYTELSGDVDDLKSALDMFKAKNVLKTALTRGEYIKGSNPNGGTPVSSNAFCRTTSLLSGYGEKISIEITDPRYEFYVSYYGANGALDGTDYLGYSGYQSAFVIPENALKIGISFRRVDHANLAADELTNISNAIYYTGITDVSLSLVGKAADAKATGQAISNAGFYWSDDSNSLIRTFSDVIAKYDELCAIYPDYIRKNALTSGDFTNYEYILTIGNYNSQNGHRGQDPEIAKPVILITAGVHGDERAAIAGLYGFVKAMCENVTSLNKIIYAATYRIIPVVCPSGLNSDSRINSNGVNINRNFDTTDWTLLPTGRDYSGAEPADQPETKVVQAWITENNSALLYIDWHNSAYTNEISCFLGLNTNITSKWKKKYLTAINKIIPLWAKDRNISASNIYAYTGAPTAGYSNTGTAVTYAREHNIETAFVLETSWNVNNSGKASKFSIGVGQEAFANMMVGFSDLINDSII